MATWSEKMARLRETPKAEIVQSVQTDPSAAAAVAAADDALSKARVAAVQRIRTEQGSDTKTWTRVSIEAAILADPGYRAAKDARDRAVEAAEASKVHFKFRALDSDVYDALMTKHPDPEGKARFHLPTFGPAVVAACHLDIDPDPDNEGEWIETGESMSEQDAADLIRTLSKGDADALVGAALAVNETPRVNYEALGKGSGPTGN